MPGRRPLLALVSLFAFTLPACLSVRAEVGPKPIPVPEQRAELEAKTKAEVNQPLRGTDFGVLPKSPGTVLQKTSGSQTTSNHNTKTPKQNPAASPVNPVRPSSGEPGPFPVLPPITVPPESLLLAAVRAYTEGRPEQAIEIIRRMDKNNQDLVLAVLPILARGVTADLTNDPATTAALVEQLRGTMVRLESRAALKIEKVAFCSDVAGFGRFVARPEANPYRPNERVQLYLELRNLGNQPTGDGFLTHVQAAVEIRDANDKVVAQIDPDDHRRVPVVKFEKRLVTRSPLHDFHVLYIFAAPPAPGVYTVTVQLNDSAGRRTVKSQPAEFRVAGP